MRSTIILTACGLALAGCNQGPEVHEENASVAEVQRELAKQGGSTNFVRPGKWESQVTIEEMNIPGMPADMAGQMKGIAGRVETHQSCLTPEEAKRPKEDFFTGDNKNCRYDRFNMGGGKIDAVMKCASDGATHTMTMQGNYSPDTYAMQMSMQASGAGDAAGMTMKMRVDAKRIGECEAGES